MPTPAPTTETEHYFFGELDKVLAPDEHVLTCAYLRGSVESGFWAWSIFFSAAHGRSAFVAITERRVIFVWTRIGVRAPLHENKGVEAIERSAIACIEVGELKMALGRTDGRVHRFDVIRDVRYVSSQIDFLDRVQMWWPGFPAALPSASVHKR
jgi:hypothetical protein